LKTKFPLKRSIKYSVNYLSHYRKNSSSQQTWSSCSNAIFSQRISLRNFSLSCVSPWKVSQNSIKNQFTIKMKFNPSTLMMWNSISLKMALFVSSLTPANPKKSKSRFSSRTFQSGNISVQLNFSLMNRDTSLRLQWDLRSYCQLSGNNSLLCWNPFQWILKNSAWSETLLKSIRTFHLSK